MFEQNKQSRRVPHEARSPGCMFELNRVEELTLWGRFTQKRTHNRFEVRVEYQSGASEVFSVSANDNSFEGTVDATVPSNTFQFSLQDKYEQIHFLFKDNLQLNFTLARDGGILAPTRLAAHATECQILFDVSDLVYYIGHHDNLTGIQRVQACVLMGLMESNPQQMRGYITYNNKIRDFASIEPSYFETLLLDLSLPINARRIAFDKMDARIGILPNSQPLVTSLRSKTEQKLIIYLLGAAWVNRDYFHRILDLKRTYGALFCMTVHDLIPIYARETCDQGTAVVFEEFLRKSFLFTDHYYAVSENTGSDLIRFAKANNIWNVPVSVVENGHALDEFFPFRGRKARAPVKTDYVLFVSTIEGRKNHSYMFDVWSALSRNIQSMPTLVCVGRFGWRAEQFLEKMLVTNNLDNKVRVLTDVSDAELEALYDNCLFTVYPSTYEGWGLPVGESISKGKLCVMSDRSSLPEVAGEFGVYIRLESISDGVDKIGKLIQEPKYRAELEKRLARDFVPRTWKQVALELVSHATMLPVIEDRPFPLMKLGREYKLSELPPRNRSALGAAMIAEVSGARRGPLTGYINRDEDLLEAQAMRSGSSWYPPEDWGTWSQYPECTRTFFVHAPLESSEITIYEKLRVVGPVVGTTLRITVNGGASQDFAVDEERFVVRIVCPILADLRGYAEVRIRYELGNLGQQLAELDRIDGRRLGLGFESVAGMDNTDIAARVSMLERLLFGSGAGIAHQQPRSNSTLPGPSGRGGAKRGGRSILLKAQAGVTVVETGDQRSLTSALVSVGELVTVGSEVNTLVGDATEKILGRGWYSVEQEGVWSTGSEATLHFRLAKDSSVVFVIAVEFRCLASPDRPVKVSIIVNGVVVGTDDVRNTDYRFAHHIVDERACPDDRAFVVLVHCDRPSSPAEFGGSSDTRELGVHLRSLICKQLPHLTLKSQQQVHATCPIIGAFSDGWYAAEDSGIWSTSDGGRLVGSFHDIESPGQSSIRMTIVGRVYGTALTGPATVDLIVQGQVLMSWQFEDEFVVTKQAVLPLIALSGSQILDVRFDRKGAISPSESGEGDDRRKLGLLISEVLFEGVFLTTRKEED